MRRVCGFVNPVSGRPAVRVRSVVGTPLACFVSRMNAGRVLAPSRRLAAHLREDEHGWLHFTG
jgi:hypothetical protein